MQFLGLVVTLLVAMIYVYRGNNGQVLTLPADVVRAEVQISCVADSESEGLKAAVSMLGPSNPKKGSIAFLAGSPHPCLHLLNCHWLRCGPCCGVESGCWRHAVGGAAFAKEGEQQ